MTSRISPIFLTTLVLLFASFAGQAAAHDATEPHLGEAFSGGGVLIAHGLMYVNAGYGYNFHIAGNALVVLGLADE